MNCRDCSLLLLDFHFDALEPGPRAEVAGHLLQCTACRAELDRLVVSIRDQLDWPDEDPPEGLAERTITTAFEDPSAGSDALDDEMTPIPLRPASRTRVRLKAFAAAALLAVGAWTFLVQEREVSLAAALDGQDRFAPGGLASLRMSVFDASSETPIEGADLRVLLRGPDGKETVLHEGASDRFGTARAGLRLPDLPEGGYTLELHARRGHDATRLTRSVRIERTYRLLLTTDKPTYRPGQTIHVRALAREVATRKVPAGRELVFTVLDPRGNKVGRKSVAIDDFGTASFDFPLADELLLGTWRVEAELGGTTSGIDVSVTRAAPPRFAVAITTERPWYRPGEVIVGRVESRHFFGKPVSGARAKVTAGVFVDRFRGIAESIGVADAEGVFRFELPLPSAIPGLPLQNGSALVEIEAVVTDAAGRQAVKRIPISIAEQALSVLVVPEGGTAAAGLQNRLLALVVRPDGEPVSGATVTLSADSGRTATATTGEDGIAELLWSPEAQRREVFVEVHAPDGARIQQRTPIEVRSLPALLRTERSLYRAGETVHGEVRATSPSGAIYLDVVRDGLTILTETVPIEDGRGAFAFDLPADAAGTVSLYAYSPGRQTQRSRRTIFVGEAGDLQVTLTADRERYRPGESATLTLRVTDENGRPAAASVGVAVVDESVFALTAKEPALLKAWFLLAEELAAPRPGIDPAGLLGERRERAAALLFSTPHADEVQRLTSTPPEELSRRQTELRDDKSRALTVGIALGLLLLAVLLEGVLRTIWSTLFAKHLWRFGALLIGATLSAVLALEGWEPVLAVLLGLAPLALVLLAELIGWLFHGWSARLLAALGLCATAGAVGLVLFGANFRALFAVSANALAGDMAPSASGKASKRTKSMSNFGAQPRSDASNVELTGFADVDEPPSGPSDSSSDRPAIAHTGSDDARARIREWFPETLFWAPSVITGPDGTGSVTVGLADAITTWRISATASASDGRLGVGQGALRVFQSFFVEVDLPPALTVGDEVEIPIAVRNFLEQPQTVRLEVESADWFEPLSPLVQEVSIEAGETRGASLRLRARMHGSRQPLIVRAHGVSSGSAEARVEDAVRREVEVRPSGVRREETVSGTVNGLERIAARASADAIPGTRKVMLRLTPDVFSAALAGIDPLAASDGVEPSWLGSHPSALVLERLRRSKRSRPELEMKALARIQRGYQRLLSFEVEGGGFAWFGRGPADLELTASVLLALVDLARVYEIDPAILLRTQQWLVSRQEADGSWPASSPQDTLRTTAWISWALLESNHPGRHTERALQFLRSRAAELNDLTTLALVANALLANDEPLSEPLFDRLAEGVRVTARGDVESLALTALAFSRAGRSTEAAALHARLLALRDSHGGWGSARATALALRSLLAAESSSAGEGTVEIRVRGETVRTERFTAVDSDVLRSVDLTHLVQDGKPLEVELEATGSVRPLFQLVTHAWFSRPRLAQAMTLSVDYDRPTLAPDDTLTARVRAVWNERKPSGRVVLQLPVPPGFEVDAESVARLRTSGRVAAYALKSGELLLLLDRLPPREGVELIYRLVARYPVKSTAPSAAAWLVSRPEVRAESRQASLTITR